MEQLSLYNAAEEAYPSVDGRNMMRKKFDEKEVKIYREIKFAKSDIISRSTAGKKALEI